MWPAFEQALARHAEVETMLGDPGVIRDHGWKIEEISFSPGEQGGYKEIIFGVSGDDAYQHLKYESGGHRVQRVPKTETQGRIHTSAATVAVLPEPDEVQVEINESDII